jgi:HEPN domain-containing protein
MKDVWSEIAQELERARRARESGKEGQARVCARRAAGLAIRAYYARRGKPPSTSSAYDLLRWLAEDEQVNAETRARALRLTLRVTPEFKLPMEADLIQDAEELARSLLGDQEKVTGEG